MKQVVLSRVLSAAPVADDFEMATAADPTLPAGGLLVRTVYLSLDPYVGSTMRGRHMGAPASVVGDVPPGVSVAQVIASDAAGFSAGDWVVAETGWRELAGIPAQGVRKIDPSIAPLSTHIGVLGMPGLTGFAGAVRLGAAREGDVVLVSAAAGAVGGTFGQIAKIHGAAKVVGIAGGPEKCKLVTDTYGFDACVDYKQDGWQEHIAKETGGKINLYIENVGTQTLNIAMANLAVNGRVVLCGLTAHYHGDGPPAQMSVGMIVGKRAHVMGLVVYDFYGEQASYAAQAAQWIKDGKLAYLEDIGDGLESAPAMMAKLMEGRNIGKALVKVGPESL